MYLNNVGFRAIGRALNISFQLVHQWIKKAEESIEKTVNQEVQTSKEIAILEIVHIHSKKERKIRV